MEQQTTTDNNVIAISFEDWLEGYHYIGIGEMTTEQRQQYNCRKGEDFGVFIFPGGLEATFSATHGHIVQIGSQSYCTTEGYTRKEVARILYQWGVSEGFLQEVPNIIPVKIQLTDKDIDDIMVIAIEGGINYWCGKAEVFRRDYMGCTFASEVISQGGKLILTDIEDPNEEWILTKEKLLKGVQKWANNKSPLYLEGRGFDIGMIDADEADIIIQYALFGKIIFG